MKSNTSDGNRFYQLGVLHGGISECGNPTYPNIYGRIEDPKVFRFIKGQIGTQLLF